MNLAVVTGASSGIGAETARCIAADGASVILVGRDADRLADVRAELEAINPAGDHHELAVDLLDDDAGARVAATVRDHAGELDVLVNAAGVFDPKPFDQIAKRDLDRVWQINVCAPFLLTQALLPLFAQASAVVFVSSSSGRVGMANQSAYAATKSALEGMTRALAVELAPLGVRVNCVAPGFTATPMNERFRENAEARARVERAILCGRLGTTSDVARVIAFIASDAAAWIYGAMIPVDGGYPVAEIQQVPVAERTNP